MRKLHDILLSDSTNNALNFLRSQATTGGDDLATNVLGGSGGTIQRQKDGSLELGLGALGLGLADVEGQTRPLAESEVDEVINAGDIVSDEVDTPETVGLLAYFP